MKIFVLNNCRKYCWCAMVLVLFSSCKKGNPFDKLGQAAVANQAADFDINNIKDTYLELTSAQYSSMWGPYNVHDPSIFKDGDWFYCYSTDVGYGIAVRPGIQIRKSKDLVNWKFVGWVFNGIPAIGDDYIKKKMSYIKQWWSLGTLYFKSR
ncbi:hypothetical protein [Pedobacter sp. NJ-S-72]